MTHGRKSDSKREGQAWVKDESCGYRLWPGARSPGQDKPPWKDGKSGAKSGAIPGYATRKVPEAPAISGAASSALRGACGMVPRIQHALNQARKAEGGVKKICSDREIKDKSQYGRDMEAIDRNIAEALSAQDDTCRRPSRTASMVDQTHLLQWNSKRKRAILRQQWEQEAREGVLGRALAQRPSMRPAPDGDVALGLCCRPSGERVFLGHPSPALQFVPVFGGPRLCRAETILSLAAFSLA